MSIDSLCMRDCPRKAQLAFRSIREIICGWPLWLLATTIAVYCHGAQAHGIVGNRVFPGSFAFDDPAVMDELLFGFSRLRHPDDGTEVLDHQADWAFSRLLTPTLAIEFDGGWLHRNWGPTQRSGLDTTAVGLKALLYKNDIQEVMISAGIAWGIGGTGSQAVAANSVDTLNPGVFFGKGFGDAPASLSWLRPLATTGAVALEHPLQAAATNLGVDPASGQLQPTLTAFNDILHWGISLQYSTYYLSRRFSPGKLPKDEPVNQFIPLVEFAFDMPMPHEGKGTGTMNPGVAYVSEKWQVLAEAVIPLNGEAGHAIGVRAGLLLFLDDLFPSVFGKPLLSR